MGTPVQFDYGRRSEYLTSVLLSPYALTVPIKGHDDRFGSDFLCVGLDESDDDVRSDYQKVNPSRRAANYLLPNLRLLFRVQTKSDVNGLKSRIEVTAPSTIKTIFNNKMPYYIAIVDSRQPSPKLSLYATSERLAYIHMLPFTTPAKIHFIPGLSKDTTKYGYDHEADVATIYMGDPFLEFHGANSLERVPKKWEILKSQIAIDRFNFVYATAGLGCFKRKKRIHDFLDIEEKIFFPEGGELRHKTKQAIYRALKMLDLTSPASPDSELDKANKLLLAHFAQELSYPALYGSPGIPDEDEDEIL